MLRNVGLVEYRHKEIDYQSMPQQKKVYDYKPGVVERQIITALRKRDRESTVADIISTSGLPKYQVQDMMNQIVRDYAGQLRVTQSGEILYYFPDGLRNQRRGFIPSVKRFLFKSAGIAAKVLTILFKIWIMVMLIGYFLLFIALLLLAMVASIAGSANSRDSDRGGRDRGGLGGFGSFYLTAKVIQLFATLWLYSGSPARYDTDPYGRRRQRPKGRPLHQSVFAFVFGEDSPLKEWSEREKREFIKFIQSHKGIATIEEIMHLTGRDRNRAQELLNEFLVEFEGEPEVTETGVLIYRFPELMRTSDKSTAGPELQREFKPLIPFSRNKAGTNRWIGFFNGFNLVFGGYFLYYSYGVHTLSAQSALDRFYAFVVSLFTQISAQPVALIGFALGVVPLAFSAFFYLIPVLRRLRDRKINEGIKRDNLRKRTIANVLAGPDSVDPEEIVPQLPEEKPANWPDFVGAAIQDVAGARSIDVEEKRSAQGGKPAAYLYHIPDLKRELSELQSYRSTVKLEQYDLGKTVFDSGTEEN